MNLTEIIAEVVDECLLNGPRTGHGIAEQVVAALGIERVGWMWRYTDEKHLWSFDVAKPSGAETVDVPVFALADRGI